MGKRKELLQQMFNQKNEKKKIRDNISFYIDHFGKPECIDYIKNCFDDQFSDDTYDKFFKDEFPYNYWLYIRREGKWELESPYVLFEDAVDDAKIIVPKNTKELENSKLKLEESTIDFGERYDIRKYPNTKDFIDEIEKMLKDIEEELEIQSSINN